LQRYHQIIYSCVFPSSNLISRTLSKEKNLIFDDINIFQDQDDVNSIEFKFLHFINTLSLLLDETIEIEAIQDTLNLFYVENKNTSMKEIIQRKQEQKPILVPKNAFLETCNIKQEKSLENFFLSVYEEDHPILKILKVRNDFVFHVVVPSKCSHLLFGLFLRNSVGELVHKVQRFKK
jgi:hypothetical protein